MSLTRNLLNIIILLCVYLNRGFTEGAQERESGKVDYHTIQLSSLSPSSSCVISSTGSSAKSSLRVVHKHGACSPLRSGKGARVDHEDILRRDQARVDSIHSKQRSKNIADGLRQSESVGLPVKDEIKSDFGSGNYIVTIGIGTPKHMQTLIVDTGSDLTWTKCKQCGRSRFCNSKQKSIFNPSLSTSFYNVSLPSAECDDLKSVKDIHYTECSVTRCCFKLEYSDKSSSEGFLVKDTFTLTSSDVLDGIHFGCAEHTFDINDTTAGLLGLGRHNISFPSQTARTYNNIFSYCLPSSASDAGHLTFGSAGISESVQFTPIVTVPKMESLYGLNIVGITIGDQKLEIPSTVFSNAGAIIDSGTVITRLPPDAYKALRTAFVEKMKNYTTTSPAERLLDTCYDPTGLDTMAIPKVSLSFGGSTTVELGSNGILYQYNQSHVCLAFAGNDNDDDVAIFGSVQQKTLQVVYDKAAGRLGFAPNGCS